MMGLRAARWFKHQAKRLSYAEQALMWQAVYSCIDDMAFVHLSRFALMDRCGMASRTSDRHFKRLALLQMLVAGDDGFRLPLFYAHDRQNGGNVSEPHVGESAADLSAKMTAKMAGFWKEEKERTKEKEERKELWSPPYSPPAGGRKHRHTSACRESGFCPDQLQRDRERTAAEVDAYWNKEKTQC